MRSDLRYALRSLWKTPRFSLAAILVLALGIGATTAMFSVVYHVCLRPLAYPAPEQLVFVQESSLRHGGISPTAPATYADWRDQQDVFQSIAAAEAWGASLTGTNRPEEVAALRVSPSLLSVLRVSPMLGRGFAAEDEQTDAGRVVLLSYSLWQRRFGGDPSVIGRGITLNGASYRVVGVMPADFHFPPFWQTKAELWAPLVTPPQRAHDRSGRSLRVFARLKDGVTIERASAAMSAIASRIERAYPETNTDRGARVIPLREVVVGPVRQALLVLLGAVAFLLLIACANVANLLLSRASGRQKEIAIRLALGAGRGRLIRQLLIESMALSLAGGLLGVALSAWMIGALQASVADASRFTLPRIQEVGLGGMVLLFSFAVSSATGILFGLAPAVQFSRPDLHAALKQGGRGNSQHGRTRLRSLLVAGEIAVSLMLLGGAGLMMRSFARLGAVDAGFDARSVVTMRLILTGSPHAAPERRNVFYQQVLDRVAAVPGVDSVSGINHLPLAGDLWTFQFAVEGRPAPPPSQEPSAAFRVVFPGYFRTMRIPLLSGRDFTAHDDANSGRVVIVNETMSRRYWPGQDAIGKRIRLDASGPWYAVVAVAKDVEQSDWGTTRGNEFYFPQLQNPSDIQRYLTLVARTAGDPAVLAGSIQGAIASLDRDLPVADVQTMQQVVERAVWQPRFSTTMLGAFAGLAVLLAAIGIYGVMSYDVGRRTPEIGIRMALGARPVDVLRSVLAEGAKLTAVGTAVGIAGALLLTRYLRALLYQVSPTDPVVLAGAAALLASVALVAVWMPARRATKVHPIQALRNE
jgi:putative ABC transport system permease protein